MVEQSSAAEDMEASQNQPDASENDPEPMQIDDAESQNTTELPESNTRTVSSSPPPYLHEAFLSSDDMKSNGQEGDELTQSAAGQGNLRSTSAKFANLRAAFEKGSNGDETPSPKRQFGGRSSSRTTIDRNKDYESEFARLREDLEKERRLRSTQEEELERLRGQPTHLDAPRVENEPTARSDSTVDLKRQLTELKRNISKSTRIDNQVADSTFVQEIGVLQYELQNWIVNNFRKPKADLTPQQMCSRLESIAERQQMDRLMPIYQSWEHSARLSIYQATAMCFIMEIFTENLLFGLPTQEPWRKSLKKTLETLPDILSPAAYNRWRAMTLDEIRQSPQMTQYIDVAASGIAEIICITLSIITEAEMNEPMKVSLKAIILKAVSLAHQFRVQRPQYEFDLPTPDTAFDPDTMEDIQFDSEATAGSKIRCATFPAVYKIGDEQGDNLHLRNIIVKAKVLCSENSE